MLLDRRVSVVKVNVKARQRSPHDVTNVELRVQQLVDVAKWEPGTYVHTVQEIE